VNGEVPSRNEQLELKTRLLAVYPPSLEPLGFGGVLDVAVLTERINWQLDNTVNIDSKPGVPYARNVADNAQFIKEERDMIIELVIDRLERLALSDLTAKPVDLVKMGMCDPVRLFVKDEPHSKRKRLENRWRLISGVSLIDQLVERLLFSGQNKLEIATWMTHPSAPGLGLSDDNQLRELYLRVKGLIGSGRAAEADVTGFDWSVKAWELMLDAEIRCDLMSASALTRRLIMNRVHCLCNTVYSLPSGKMLAQTIPGVQLSGSFNTSSTNSRIRVMIAFAIGALWAIAMGDDCVEDFVEGAEAKYAKLGHPIKMYNERSASSGFEFCSQLFTETGAHPVDGTKTLYRLLEQKEITPELIYQFRMEMRNHPRLCEFAESYNRAI